jgi:hypothetical protein
MTEELVVVLIGLVLPPAVDLVNRFIQQSWLRYVVALLVSLILGGILAYAQYGWGGIAADAGVIFIASQTVYKLWYDKSGLQTRIR